MIKQFNANRARLRRHQRVRRHLAGTSSRPRLNVFRSGQHIYAQIIDDVTGMTLVAASSLDEGLRDFKPAQPVSSATSVGAQLIASVEEEPVAAAAEAEPVKGKGSKAEKAKAPAKGGKPGAQAKTVLPSAQKRERKTPQEALVSIANNHKVALAREVGKLVAQRAQEKGVTRVVFDRGGYAYHGRVAALAEGAREVGLEF
jgi:ribosomal protein L18